ncbi:V8-like Glu-specific endopeptidase [Luteitalea pratensis]|uniref:V8-like Glu-specific endopeptidase n=1 Tax=Luteitalea pratensis TaxID=1855912 RepID=A0A143PTT6_LUTPR|nr:trypsin-like serine protease [Luteitalea pratensis]AMY12002.1 V8-like Glu-specific endopeptidase [Luteitalea pratensis]
MRSRSSAIALALLAVSPVASLLAVTYGFVDTDGTYSNTGAFIVRSPTTGNISPICSGTLIAPDVFLTASHCTAFFEHELAALGYTAHVSFDSPIGFGDQTSPATHLIEVQQVVTNPAYTQAQNDSGDIAVLLLNSQDTAGIAPATLAPAALLDEIVKADGFDDASVTNVGYGVQNRVVGGGRPFFQDMNPIPRMYSFSSFNALNKGYIRYSQNPATGDGGTCFGDSGGPQFFTYQGTTYIVSITITGDTVCRATSVAYRLDTKSARSFLAPYVTLP